MSQSFRTDVVSDPAAPPPAAEGRPAPGSSNSFTADELAAFERDGFLIVRGLADAALRARMLAVTREGLSRLVEPIEYESDVQYPGAPESRSAEGGGTPRRLKQAHSRDHVFTEWLTLPALTGRLRQLLGPDLYCPLAHHNCIMTKEPRFSSDTGWHQDLRYWSFQRPELVNVWLALGSERPENGCLQVIPGTHRMMFDRGRFDAALFLRPDLPENVALIARRAYAELNPGDALFFHCRTFHAASRNHTGESKFSVVFTFHGADNAPVAGTRSAESPEIVLRG